MKRANCNYNTACFQMKGRSEIKTNLIYRMRETKQKKETNVVSTSKREKDKHVNTDEKEKCQEQRA